MAYVLQHKKHGTFYCFDKEDKRKYFSIQLEKAYRFKYESSARRILNKLKKPENWQIKGIREGVKRAV